MMMMQQQQQQQQHQPPSKRRLSRDDGDDGDDDRGLHYGHGQSDAKRRKAVDASVSEPSIRDVISRLSDELLIRVLSYFNERELVDMSPTSRRFHNLTSDSQLWRPLYYRRFVLPRAHLIPGFRTTRRERRSYKLHFGEGREQLWADGGFGRSSGVVARGPPAADAEASLKLAQTVDWKKSYKQWHNWERGRCSVDELPLHDIPSRRTYAKFVNGYAVTADVISGLRVWDLRTRQLVAQAHVHIGDDADAEPTCVTVDGQGLAAGVLGVAVGLDDGTFGIWKMNVMAGTMKMVCRHTVKRVGALVALAYLHPYVVTATSAHLVVVYTLEHPMSEETIEETLAAQITGPATPLPENGPDSDAKDENLITPYLILTFNGRNTMPPRALSIRRTASAVVASIAYTFNTYGGWCIGVQDFDIKPNGNAKPEVVMSRTASTPPKHSPKGRYSYEGSAMRTWWPRNENPEESDSDDGTGDDDEYDSPVSLCYSHPYLLATMSDNTMMLHMCTSTATSLSISAGSRLFGHTSAISDAAITPWGKAVSVSSRGNDVRLWRLEGGLDGSSVALQPREQQRGEADRQAGEEEEEEEAPPPLPQTPYDTSDLEDRRNWVGFDDERVVVLKQSPAGKGSFLVYDFT